MHPDSHYGLSLVPRQGIGDDRDRADEGTWYNDPRKRIPKTRNSGQQTGVAVDQFRPRTACLIGRWEPVPQEGYVVRKPVNQSGGRVSRWSPRDDVGAIPG